MGRLGPQSVEWVDAIRQSPPGDPPTLIAQKLRGEPARQPRIDGAIAGSVSISPLSRGISGLWQATRMSQRTAALYRHDPRELHTAAIGLALRGVHPTIDRAEPALRTVSAVPMPEKPAQRRPLRTWNPQHPPNPDLRRLHLASQRKAEASRFRPSAAGGADPGDRSRGLGDHVLTFMIAMARGSRARSVSWARAYSRSSRTPIRSASPQASTGSTRWERSSPCRW
jgi:hypothetical protein